MQTNTGYFDGELFLARLEEAQSEGDTDFVAAYMSRLERLIARYKRRMPKRETGTDT
jgi:hypothetical protein